MNALTRADVDFLAAAVTPEVEDRGRLKQLLETDEDFRQAFVGHEQVARRMMADKEAFVKISPPLYFEILLRQARQDLESASFTLERVGTQKVAVFDIPEVVDLLARPPMLFYLADMLASFTRIESYTISYRVGEGIWRKVRFNDLDLDSLMRFSNWVEEEHRLGFFKRIADICLFTLGIFPDYIHFSYRYPSSGERRPQVGGAIRWDLSDYQDEGRRFYRLAAEHRNAQLLELTEIFQALYQDFHKATKPLTFIAYHYLHSRRHHLFRIG